MIGAGFLHPAPLARPMAHHQQHHATNGGDQASMPMFRTRHALPQDVRERLCVMLNQNLADSFDLFAQTKHAHWNVKGINFYQLHKLFDELAEIVEGHVDTIAERITALGGFAAGTARMAAANSRLPEMGNDVVSDEWSCVDALIQRYASHARNVGQAIMEAEELHDKGTADMLTDVVSDLDKALYFLEAHVQGRGAQR